MSYNSKREYLNVLAFSGLGSSKNGKRTFEVDGIIYSHLVPGSSLAHLAVVPVVG